MPRNINTPSAATITDLDDSKIDSAVSASMSLATINQEAERQTRFLAQTIGYELPGDSADADLIQRAIRADMQRSVEACINVGKGLLVLRQACGYGTFAQRLEVMGIDPRVAQKFMGTARRFSNAASTPLLKAAGNQTKLFEMLVLDDEAFDELVSDGLTGALGLDDIAKMSVKELRHALREAKQDNVAKDTVMANKDAKLNKLEAAATHVTDIDWVQRYSGVRLQVTVIAEALKSSYAQLESLRKQVLSLDDGITGSIHDDDIDGAKHGVFSAIEHALRDAEHLHGLCASRLLGSIELHSPNADGAGTTVDGLGAQD